LRRAKEKYRENPEIIGDESTNDWRSARNEEQEFTVQSASRDRDPANDDDSR